MLNTHSLGYTKFMNPRLFLLQTNMTHNDRAHTVLGILPKRGYNAMGVFVNALIKTHQKFIAEQIAPDMCGEYVSWVFRLLYSEEE